MKKKEYQTPRVKMIVMDSVENCMQTTSVPVDSGSHTGGNLGKENAFGYTDDDDSSDGDANE